MRINFVFGATVGDLIELPRLPVDRSIICIYTEILSTEAYGYASSLSFAPPASRFL